MPSDFDYFCFRVNYNLEAVEWFVRGLHAFL